MWIDILLHHITSDSPTYDLIMWIKMFVSDNQLGLICVFVFKLTTRSIKYRGPLRAAFCMTCSLLMLVGDAIGDHMDEAYSRVGLMTAL